MDDLLPSALISAIAVTLSQLDATALSQSRFWRVRVPKAKMARTYRTIPWVLILRATKKMHPEPDIAARTGQTRLILAARKHPSRIHNVAKA